VLCGGSGQFGAGWAIRLSSLSCALKVDRPVDLAALYAALHQPGEQMTTGVAVTACQVLAELGPWLALHDPDAGRLVALGDAITAALVPPLIAFPGMTSTTALIGAQALAALAGPDSAAPTDSFTVGVRPFGPDSTDLAQRLAAHVRAWDAAGRPSTAKLRIRAYPLHEAPADPATFVLDKRHTRLLIDWKLPISVLDSATAAHPGGAERSDRTGCATLIACISCATPTARPDWRFRVTFRGRWR